MVPNCRAWSKASVLLEPRSPTPASFDPAKYYPALMTGHHVGQAQKTASGWLSLTKEFLQYCIAMPQKFRGLANLCHADNCQEVRNTECFADSRMKLTQPMELQTLPRWLPGPGLGSFLYMALSPQGSASLRGRTHRSPSTATTLPR